MMGVIYVLLSAQEKHLGWKTIGIMGGQQIASVGKIIQVEMSYLQFPAAAANAVMLLAVVLMIIVGLTVVLMARRR